MAKNLYIDASHPNETRVVLKSDDNIEDYEYESINNSLIKNNIYLGKVSRIEPSLQAAFVDFGRERHGFLSSADKNELITILGIVSYGTNILFSDEKSLTNSPPPEYNLLETAGLYIFKNL